MGWESNQDVLLIGFRCPSLFYCLSLTCTQTELQCYSERVSCLNPRTESEREREELEREREGEFKGDKRDARMLTILPPSLSHIRLL